MEYPTKFIIIYALWQIILALSGYFYYYSFLRKLYLKKKRLPFPVGFSQHIVFLLHGIILYLPYYLFTNWPEIYVGKVQSSIGLITCSIGLIILFGEFINLGAYLKTIGINSGSLKIKGLYRLSRNPQALGYSLFLVSLAVVWPSWYIIIALGSFCIIIHRMVLTEEIHLQNVFGEEYIEYCKLTPRYLF